MLLRFAAENIMSFRAPMEFNTFPSSRSHSHEWHKIKCGNAAILRMSAIYGANGAGKSNILRGINLLKEMVCGGTLSGLVANDIRPFKLDSACLDKPSELAIEFFSKSQTFYYHIVFDTKKIFREELFLSGKDKDVPLFSRIDNDVTIGIEKVSEKEKEEFIKVFSDVVKRMIRSDMPALFFFGEYYAEEFPLMKDAYEWFKKLQIVLPSKHSGFVPHMLDTDRGFLMLANEIISDLGTGISKLAVRKEAINENEANGNPGLKAAIEAARCEPGTPQLYRKNMSSVISNLVFEDGLLVVKSLMAVHTDNDNKEVETAIDIESDGTKRMIEYLPLLYSILKSESVFIVDEIERSIHPILIKAIVSKISESREAKGQLIFTTHESCLLDQSIFRPDEIWFAQKDVDQSTQLYPLSDYSIHKTANIENGYLNGRYGGIPFLSNLEDLKW